MSGEKNQQAVAYKLSELPGSNPERKSVKRIGRGAGSGQGKTAGKGHKGQNARAGGGVRLGFEGTMPLYRRVVKFGFNNTRFKKVFVIVNIADLEARFESGQTLDTQSLKQAGLIKRTTDRVKVLGNGELKKKFTVQAKAFSKTAVRMIEAAGGKAEVI